MRGILVWFERSASAVNTPIAEIAGAMMDAAAPSLRNEPPRFSFPDDRCGERIVALRRRKAIAALVRLLLRPQLGVALLRHLPANAIVGALSRAGNVPAVLAQKIVHLIQ